MYKILNSTIFFFLFNSILYFITTFTNDFEMKCEIMQCKNWGFKNSLYLWTVLFFSNIVPSSVYIRQNHESALFLILLWNKHQHVCDANFSSLSSTCGNLTSLFRDRFQSYFHHILESGWFPVHLHFLVQVFFFFQKQMKFRFLIMTW